MAFLKRSTDKDIRQDIHLPSLVTKDRYKDESDYCQICRLKGKKRIAEHFCSNCQLPLCPACKNTHQTTRVTADHFIVGKKERDVSSDTCPVHRFAKVQYFCDTCLQLVCVNCTMIEHKKHDIMEIPDKVEQCHKTVSDTIEMLDGKLRSFEGSLKKLADLEGDIEANRDQVKSEINQQVVYLQQRIRSQQEDLIRQLDKYLDEKIQTLAKRKETVQTRYNDMMNTRMQADIRNRGDLQDEAFIQNTIQLEKEVAKLKDGVPPNDIGHKYMTFTLTNDARLGNIEESDTPHIKQKKDQTHHKKDKPAATKKAFGPIKKASRPKASASTASVDQDDRNSEPAISGRTAHSQFHASQSEPAFSRSSRVPPIPQSRASQHSPAKAAPTPQKKTSQQQNGSAGDDPETPNLRIVNRFKTINYQQNPSGIGVLPNGKYVVVDASNYGILICDKSGRWQQRLHQDEIAFPTGVAITRDGDIAVATHKYIKIFKVDGVKVKQFQVSGSNSGALAIDDYGHFVVVDNNSKRVVVYDEDGMQLRTLEPPDLKGMRPDAFNIGVGGDHLALSYTSAEGYSVVKLYNYKGDLLKSCELPQPCRGIQMDRFGNMIVAAGDLLYVPAKGNDIMPLRAVDKKDKLFRLTTRCVAFTPQGLICTLHINRFNQRSEVMILHLGG